MKKILALIISSILILSLVACAAEETTIEDPANKNELAVGNDEKIITPSVNEDSWGYEFWKTFYESVKNKPDISTSEIVSNIIESDAGKLIIFPETLDVEEGFLTGFSEEITGFKTATLFAPAASGFAFVGYVFELDKGVNAREFIDKLDENKNMRWMVCMTAEAVTAGAYDNYVFFAMCPEKMPTP